MSEDEPYIKAAGLDELDQITYDAICQCDETYGDYPWCPACYPKDDWITLLKRKGKK